MYKCKYFKIEELVSKNMYEKYGDRCWELFDPRILESIDEIRQLFKQPITVNNWHIGGRFQYRGFRESECKEGSEFSQHRFGRAIDFDIKNILSSQARQGIIKYYKEWFPYIKYVEDDVNWNHIDCRNSKYDGIHLFKKS